MSQLRALAQQIITQEWRVPVEVVDAMWDTLAAVPLTTTKVDRRRLEELTLADGGARTQQVAIAVLLFTQAAHTQTPETTMDELKATIATLGDLFSTQGIAKRLTIACDLSIHTDTTTPPEPSRSQEFVGVIFTDERPDGYAATKQDRDAWLAKISTVMIFIRHELNLPYGYKGDLYLRNDDGPPMLDDEVPKLQYNILRHLLRHQAAKAKRTLPAIMKACWSNETTAVRQADELQDGTNKPDRKYDTAITKLSKILQARCGIVVRTAQTGIYDLQPPSTYCLIEEGKPSDDT